MNFRRTIKTQIGITALLALIGFFLSTCEKTEKEKQLSGTVTADTEGSISFMYSRTDKDNPDCCTFTTGLPAPDESTGKKLIEGLTAEQKVSWKATVVGKPLNHGSEHFVHIIN